MRHWRLGLQHTNFEGTQAHDRGLMVHDPNFLGGVWIIFSFSFFFFFFSASLCHRHSNAGFKLHLWHMAAHRNTSSFNPQGEARDRTFILMVGLISHNGNFSFLSFLFLSFSFFFFLFFSFPFFSSLLFFYLFFLGLLPWHLEVPRLGIESDLQLPSLCHSHSTVRSDITVLV